MKMTSKTYCLKVGGRLFERGTHIMGIINVDSDSFFEGSRVSDARGAALCAGKMLSEGAEILDVGGQSTRPGADVISSDEELSRVIPAIRAIKEARPDALLSVDTFYASVAEAAARAGADMINDVSCLADENMAAVAAKYGLAICVMHNRRGSTERDMVADKLAGLERAERRLIDAGVGRDKILLDGGIGFNLSREEDVELLARYGELVERFDLPFLLGASRKSFLGGSGAGDRLPATLETTRRAVQMGALFVRVHDVKENAIAIANATGEYQS